MKTYNLENVAWLGLDLHAHHSVLGWVDRSGERRGHWRFATNEREIVRHIKLVPVAIKQLVMEECCQARWAAQIARPHTSEVVVCDPHYNRQISHHHNKCDEEDVYGLALAHRMGAIKVVWQPTSDERAIFKTATQGYLAAVERQSAIKKQIKAQYRQWGVVPTGSAVYSVSGRESWLKKIEPLAIRSQLNLVYEMLDGALEGESKSRRLMIHAGKAFPEIKRLQTMPGVGAIGAHVFVAFVQDPVRFQTPQQLFHYSRLGICDRSSDGKPLGYQRLDGRGHGELKAMSYRAWLTAMKHKTGPLHEFYEQSLERTHDKVHARLNTLRKVLRTLAVMWEEQKDFDADKFLGRAAKSTTKATCS